MIRIKRNRYSKTLIVLLTIVDCFVLSIAFNAAFWIDFNSELIPAGQYQALRAVMLLSWIVSSLLTNAYQPDKLRSIARITKGTIQTFFLHVLILAAYFIFFNAHEVSENFVILAQALFLLVSIVIKFALLQLYSLIRNTKNNRSKVIIVGYTNAGRELHRFFKDNKSAGFEFMGFFDDSHHNHLVQGTLDNIKDFCIKQDIKEIFYAMPTDKHLIHELTTFADDNFIHFGLVQDLTGLSYNRLHTFNYGDQIPVLSYTKSSIKKSLPGKIYTDLSLKMKNIPTGTFSN